MTSTKSQTIFQRQLPEFIRADYPKFTAFLRAYYEYMDIIDDRDIIELRDIDSTVDSFIDYFKGEIGFNVPDLDHMDMRLFLRKSKQAFTSKGTEESYKFLFRVLFDKPVDIYYPWDQVLKPSDGKWKRDTSIFVHFDDIVEVVAEDIIPGVQYRIISVGNTDFISIGASDNNLNTVFIATSAGTGTGMVSTSDELQNESAINSMVGNTVTVTGTGKFINVYVDRVKKIRERVYELSIDKNYYGNIDINDKVVFNNYSIKIAPTVVNYNILSKGKNYKVGDLIIGTSIEDGITIEQTLKVTKVDSTGGILAIIPVKFGCGYKENFYLLTSKKQIQSDSTLSVKRDLVDLYSSPDSGLEEYIDYGNIISSDYFQSGYSDPTYAGTTLKTFYDVSKNNKIDSSELALLELLIGAVAKYQGYYISNDGFLSDAIKMQDSKFYQKFSYVLVVDETIESYRSYVKSFLHSAGMAMYGEYQITNRYNLEVGGSFILKLGV